MSDQQKSVSKTRLFFRKPFVLPVIGIILGIVGGYIYYIEIGCRSGSCPITSNPWLSMLWGGILGFLIFDMFRRKPKKKKTEKEKPS